MKFTTHAALALASAGMSAAHYTFSALIVNDQQVGKDWQYVRQHQNGYMPTKFKNIPEGSISPLDTDFRCNKGASSGANTEVYTVKAGDSVAIKQAFGGTGMKHPGPTQIYLSQAPGGDVKSYAGDGEWFKLYQSLICTAGNAESLRSTAWCSYGEDRIGFTIPDTLPAGQYLMRVEHIALHGAHNGEAEFYYSCAQIEVEGTSGSSALTPTTSIPGVYAQADPEVNFSIWGTSTSYNYIPGIDVAAGGQIRGSADGSSKATVTVGGGSSGSGSGSGNNSTSVDTGNKVITTSAAASSATSAAASVAPTTSANTLTTSTRAATASSVASTSRASVPSGFPSGFPFPGATGTGGLPGVALPSHTGSPCTRGGSGAARARRAIVQARE